MFMEQKCSFFASENSFLDIFVSCRWISRPIFRDFFCSILRARSSISLLADEEDRDRRVRSISIGSVVFVEALRALLIERFREFSARI